MIAMKVLGQRIICELPDALASGQVDFASFRFEFSPDWDNLDKTAQFTQDGTTYNMHLGTGTPLTCYMPAEIVDGIVYVSVFGLLEGESQIATTAPLRLRVARSGYGDGIDGDSGLTPTLYAQLLEEIDEKIAAACTAGTSAYCTVETDEDGVVTITAIDANGTTVATVTSGKDGADGQDGQDGKDGASAYEIWLEQGNTGTEEEFLTSLKGEKGDTGEQGEQGEKGDTGEAGADGKDGTDGVSPIVTVEDTEDGVLITITDATGTTTANLTAGADGKDGYSPTVEVFKQATAWAIQDGQTAYFDGDTTVTSFDVTDLDSVELVTWWLSSGDSIPLTVTLTDSAGSTTSQSLELSAEESITLDTSDAVSISIATTGSQRATGQLIYNDETAEAGYYLKITWYNDETGETETIITDNLKGSNGSDGQDGQDGEDGYSPSASVEQTSTGATITITDKDGTTTATITNGSSGGGSDLTGGETDYGVIDISDNVVTLSSAVGKSTGYTGAEIFNDYTNNYATGNYATAMGQYSTASGQNSLAASAATAQGDYSIAMGISCVAGNMYSVAIGNTAKTSANHGVSIGYYTTASGQHAVALGGNSTASGENAFVAGTSSTASGTGSAAIGYNVEASGQCGMAINGDTVASGAWALAAGRGTIAASTHQTALGAWNVEDAEHTYALIIGNGSSDEARSNLLTVDWNGNVNISGDLVVNNENSVTEIAESVTDSGWQDMTASAGSTTLSDITLQYRTIGKQLYIKGNFTTNATISADSHVFLAASAAIGDGDAFATGSGGEKSTTGAGITCYMYTNGINYFEFQLPTALDSGTTIYFGMSGTID